MKTVWLWAINFDGEESCLVPCAVVDCREHFEHFKTFAKAKKDLIKFHLERAQGYKQAAAQWRKAKEKDWA